MTLHFFLTQSLGFFIQLFPAMMLCFLPFEKENLRMKPKIVQCVTILYAILTAVAFPFIIHVPDPSDMGLVCSRGNVFMLFVICSFCVGYGWVLRDSAMKKAATLILVVFYAATQYLLVNMILPNYDDGMIREGMVYTLSALWLFIGTTLLLFPVMVYLMRKPLRAYMKEIEPHTMRRDFLVAIILSLCYFATMFYYTSIVGFGNIEYGWVFCPPFLFATVTLILFYLVLFREAVLRKRESEYLQHEKIQDIQYQKQQQDMENAARIRHDTRHHYRALYEMVTAHRDREASAYLSDLIEQTTHQENIQYCLNSTLNALLQYYIGMAEAAGIHCEVSAECGSVNISPLDLSTIVGNILENAINACVQSGEASSLLVEIGHIDAQLAIQVENSCADASVAKPYQGQKGFLPADAFVSRKKTGGYGLQNIAIAATRYSGDASFSFDKQTHTFTSRIRLTAGRDAPADIQNVSQ